MKRIKRFNLWYRLLTLFCFLNIINWLFTLVVTYWMYDFDLLYLCGTILIFTDTFVKLFFVLLVIEVIFYVKDKINIETDEEGNPIIIETKKI